MDGPNVLILDEPTNDFDVETLSALEDLLDSFAGTLVVVSHDRYFCERVTDHVYALLGDGKVRHLPRGIDEYLQLRELSDHLPLRSGDGKQSSSSSLGGGGGEPSAVSAGERRAAKKALTRLERAIAACDKTEAQLHEQLSEHASDYEKCVQLNEELRETLERKNEAELEWMVLAEQLEAAD